MDGYVGVKCFEPLKIVFNWYSDGIVFNTTFT